MTLFAGVLASCGQQEFRTVDADEFEKAVSAGDVQLVDVRTEDEYNEGHLSFDGVKNIDMKQPDFINRAEEELDKGKTVAVYCRSGNRSKTAMKILLKKGFKVYELDKGFNVWKSSGMKIEY